MTSTGPPPLRGRDQELSRAREVLRAAATEGCGGVLWVEGPPGIGKSRLLDAVAEAAARMGARVARGGADEFGPVPPLGPLLDALLSARPPLLPAGALEGLSGAVDLRLTLVEHLAGRLEEAAAEQPVLVALDDLQWADAATVAVLARLPTRLAASPVVWALGRRGHPPAPALDAVAARLRRGGATLLSLPPLQRSDVLAAAEDALGARVGDDLGALLDQAGGNPFLVVEVVRALRDEGALVVEAGRARLGSHELPGGFRTSVRRSLAALSPEARELLQVGAVLGRRFSVQDVAALLGRPVSTRLPVLAEVLGAGVVEDDGTALRFRHDLVREAVYADLPPSVRASVHREAAQALLDRGGDVLAAVPHLLAGARSGDGTGVRLADAAEQLARSAPAAAADLVTRALELTPADDPGRAALVVRAVPLLAYADRRPEAEALAAGVLGRALPLPPADAAGLRLALALSRYLGGDFAGALEALDAALADPAVPDPLRLPLVATRLQVATSLHPPDAGTRADIAELTRLGAGPGSTVGAGAAGTAMPAALGASARAQVRFVEGDAGSTVAELLAAVPLWPQLPPVLRGDRVLLVLALTQLDRFDAAATELRTGMAEADRAGLAFLTPIWHQLHAAALARVGDLDAARAEAETAWRLGRELGGPQGDVQTAGLLAVLALRRDDPAETRRWTDEVRHILVDRVGGDWSRTGAGTAASALASAGRAAEAGELLAPATSGVAGLLRLFPGDPATGLVEVARLAVEADDRSSCAAALRVAGELAERSPGVASATAAHEHVEGLVHRRPGALLTAARLTEATPQLQGAHVAALLDLGRVLGLRAERPGPGHPRAPVDLAAHTPQDVEVLHGTEAREVAVAALDAAWRTARRWGSAPATRQAQAELRRLGARRRSWLPAATAPTSGWAALTAAEARVAELAARGESNRAIAEALFLSPHTVNTHLSRVFTKLGVRSRVQLARLAPRPIDG